MEREPDQQKVRVEIEKLIQNLKDRNLEIYKNRRCQGGIAEMVHTHGIWLPVHQLSDDIDKVQHILDFDVRPDDVYVTGFPRCGNTVVIEMVYLIMNDVDVSKALSDVQDKRVPFLEYPLPGLKSVSEMTSPRIIKTHMPFHLLPTAIFTTNPKVIYVMRNSKDACVSLYNFMQFITAFNFQGTFEEFVKDFIDGKVMWGPFFEHVKQFWENKQHFKDILFVKYEDLKRDIHSTIQRIGEFLDKPLSAADIAVIADHCNVNKMRQNHSANFSQLVQSNAVKQSEDKEKRSGFIRKGVVGDWKNYFTPDIEEQVEQCERHSWSPLSFCYQNNQWNF